MEIINVTTRLHQLNKKNFLFYFSSIMKSEPPICTAPTSNTAKESLAIRIVDVEEFLLLVQQRFLLDNSHD